MPLKAENSSLKTEALKSQKQNEHLIGLLQLNDAIIEHKEEFVSKFQEDFEKRKDGFFEAMGGNGKLAGFEVEDVFEYKGYLGVVTMLFVWTSSDSSGAVGRGFIALNPDKNYDISDCEMLGQRQLSPEEYASLSDDKPTRIENEAPPESESPNPEKFEMTNETKNHLVESGVVTGLGVLSAYIIHLINSDN